MRPPLSQVLPFPWDPGPGLGNQDRGLLQQVAPKCRLGIYTLLCQKKNPTKKEIQRPPVISLLLDSVVLWQNDYGMRGHICHAATPFFASIWPHKRLTAVRGGRLETQNLTIMGRWEHLALLVSSL